MNGNVQAVEEILMIGRERKEVWCGWNVWLDEYRQKHVGKNSVLTMKTRNFEPGAPDEQTDRTTTNLVFFV